MSVLHEVAAINVHLVEITTHCDEQAEAGASREWTVMLPLLTAPAAMLEGVGDHITRGARVIARVQVKSNVCIGPGTTL